VDRQYADACKAAEILGLGAVERFTDNDRSASAFRTKERERWEELLEDIGAGKVSHVLFWLFDRAFRTTDDASRFLAACRAHGVLIVQTGGWSPMVVNPSDPDAVYNMKQAANQAEYEVAKMSMRQRRHKEAMAEAGVSHGGGRRFGYLPGMTDEHPTEGPIVRQLVDRLLSGESLSALARWLNEEGIPTPSTEYRLAKGKTPAKWTGPNLRGMLKSPHLAGRRIHHGRDVGPAAWPALIPVEKHDHVVALLNNPARRPKGATNVRKYLLPGIMVCDACGLGVRSVPAYVNTYTGGHKKRSYPVPAAYRCPTGRHTQRTMATVDRVVELAIVERLTQHDAAGLFTDDAAAEELLRLRDQRQAVADQLKAYAGRVLTMDPEAYELATKELRKQADHLDLAIVEATTEVRQASRVLRGATGPGAALAWFGPGGPDGDRAGGWSLARRRAIIAEVAEVRLKGGRHGTTPKGSRFDPRDVVIRFL